MSGDAGEVMAGKTNKQLWLLALGLPLTLGLLAYMGNFAWTHPMYSIPSESGVPTLLKGDLILARGSKFVCGSIQPEPGDIVIYQRGGTSYLKRLVGMPGDRIQFKNGVIFINDRPSLQTVEGHTTLDLGGFQTKADIVHETLPNGRSYQIALVDRTGQLENTPVTVLSEGQYYFVGDNRDNSLDSRLDGPTPRARLCAVALRVISSPDSRHVWKAL